MRPELCTRCWGRAVRPRRGRSERQHPTSSPVNGIASRAHDFTVTTLRSEGEKPMHRNRKRTSISANNLAYMLMVLLAVAGLAKPQTGREASQKARIERVLSGLRPPIAIKGQPPVRWTLAERMAASHVPGLSIAVIDDCEIAWARGFGVRAAGIHE